jgi:hypothetical protein
MKLIITTPSHFNGKQQSEERGKEIHFPVVSSSENVNIPLMGSTHHHPQRVYPTTRGMFISPCSEMKLENSNTAGHIRASSDLSLVKRVTLKTPLMHQGKSHQLSKPASSSRKYLLSSLAFGPQTPKQNDPPRHF